MYVTRAIFPWLQFSRYAVLERPVADIVDICWHSYATFACNAKHAYSGISWGVPNPVRASTFVVPLTYVVLQKEWSGKGSDSLAKGTVIKLKFQLLYKVDVCCYSQWIYNVHDKLPPVVCVVIDGFCVSWFPLSQWKYMIELKMWCLTLYFMLDCGTYCTL